MDNIINRNNDNKLNTIWAKAAIIGSTWAAIEIIAGSFLHNLKVPFAGTLLASIGIFLLISYTKIWNERGLIIKAALICALMKSISPSAIIIGPMIGIFMEGAILELILIILGRNAIGFIIGGGLAVLWSLTQKVLYLLLMYGLDIINLAKALYIYMIKISGINSLNSIGLIIGISLIYFSLGAISAFAGFKVATNKTRESTSVRISKKNDSLSEKLKINNQLAQKYSIALLFSNLAIIITILYLINHNYYISAIVTGLFFISFCLFRYKNATKHLKKPGLWIQFIAITMIAIMLWEWATTGNHFSSNGLEAGLKMIGRAIIIIFGFAVTGTELRNPIIVNVLYQNKLQQLQKALTFAFSTLPVIIETLPSPRHILSKRSEIISKILDQSKILLSDAEDKEELHYNNRSN